VIVTTFPRAVGVIEHTLIPLKDGTMLAARIWLPDDAEQNPVPAVLEYLPYRKRDGTRADMPSGSGFRDFPARHGGPATKRTRSVHGRMFAVTFAYGDRAQSSLVELLPRGLPQLARAIFSQPFIGVEALDFIGGAQGVALSQ
jgi:hypothetical protein